MVGDSASDISVSSIASNGAITLLTTGYTVSLNAANPNQLWGVGGSVVFSVAPVSGTQILIQRTLPLTQETSIQNQGNYYSQVVEQALDTLEMQIQQVAGRTTQFQGIWTTATNYTVGDIVQDGINGNDTLSYYICQIANTSGVWATDLANGDWAISVQAIIPTTNQPITLTGAVSGSGTTSITTGFPGGGIGLSSLAKIPADTILCNASAISASPTAIPLSASTLLGMGSSGSIQAISLSGLTIGSNEALTPNPIFNSAGLSNPAGTTSTGGVMAGLGALFIPTYTPVIGLIISGNMANNQGSTVGSQVRIRYGTGSPPLNGASLTGTTTGSLLKSTNTSTNGGYVFPFTCIGIASGLSTGITYWADLEVASISTGSTNLNNLSISYWEIH